MATPNSSCLRGQRATPLSAVVAVDARDGRGIGSATFTSSSSEDATSRVDIFSSWRRTTLSAYLGTHPDMTVTLRLLLGAFAHQHGGDGLGHDLRVVEQ